MVGLSLAAIAIKTETGEIADVLRWSQTVIDLANGDPTKGNFILGSPLAVTLASRGIARWALGRPGWRDDLDEAVAMARSTDPVSHSLVITWKYCLAIAGGVLQADDAALRDIDEALRIAERSSDDFALAYARSTMGLALVHRDSIADRDLGLELLGQVRDMCLHGRFYLSELPAVDVWAARERAKRGDRDGAIHQMCAAVDDLFRSGQLGYCVPTTGVLVETLLERGAGGEVREAEAAIDRLAAAQGDEGLVIRDVWLLRMRALLARAQGDGTTYREYRDRYRAMTIQLGFEGHMKWAEAMP